MGPEKLAATGLAYWLLLRADFIRTTISEAVLFSFPLWKKEVFVISIFRENLVRLPQIKLTESGFPLLSLDHLSQHRASKTSPTRSGHPDLVLPNSQWQKANQCSTLCQHVFRVLSLILFCLATF